MSEPKSALERARKAAQLKFYEMLEHHKVEFKVNGAVESVGSFMGPALDAFLSELAKGGHVIVPREASCVVKSAGAKVLGDSGRPYSDEATSSDVYLVADIFRAMIEASVSGKGE
jgi:hypothetical protein